MALVVKNLPANVGDARDLGSIPGLGRSPAGGNGNPLQYSCLENSKERGTWQGVIQGAAKSRIQWSTHTEQTTTRGKEYQEVSSIQARIFVFFVHCYIPST